MQGLLLKKPVQRQPVQGGSGGLMAASNMMASKNAYRTMQETKADKAAKVRAQSMNKVLAQRPEYMKRTDFEEFNKAKEFAYGTEDSPYAALQKQRAGLMTSQAVDDAAIEGQRQAANAYSQLAMGGGLSSGARERIGGDVGQAALLARQAARRQGSLDTMGIDATQAQQRQTAQERIIDATMGDRGGQNEYNQEAWRTKAEVLAARDKAASERSIAALSRK